MKKLIYLFLALIILACGSDDGGGNDSTAPIITLNGQAIATVNLNSTYTDAGATATDEVDGDLTSSIVTTGVVNTSIEGNYIITYTVSDTSGNTATATRQVIVEDDGNPVYLAENGITIKAKEWALVGDSGVVNGIGYTIVDAQTLVNMVSNGEDVTRVCTSRVLDMICMFCGSSFNQNISTWDTSNVTDMSFMFQNNSTFNQPIGNWDVSSVTNMGSMFGTSVSINSSFNQPIGDWDVSNVTNMSAMFGGAIAFNQPIGNWDVSNVTDMYSMLNGTPFNQDISFWDVSSVTNMDFMFNSTPFNQDISFWDVSSVTDMRYMLGSTPFNQDLSSWNVDNVISCSYFSDGAPLTEENTPNFTNCTP